MIFDKAWMIDNKFFESLTHAEFRIMVYLLSSTLKITKSDKKYKQGDLFAKLYHKNRLLVVNTSTPKIAERSKTSRTAVCTALNKFHDYGAAIRISSGGKLGENNLYIVGFRGKLYDERDYFYFIDSIPLKNGDPMPENLKRSIETRYMDTMYNSKTAGWKELFGKGGVPTEFQDMPNELAGRCPTSGQEGAHPVST